MDELDAKLVESLRSLFTDLGSACHACSAPATHAISCVDGLYFYCVKHARDGATRITPELLQGDFHSREEIMASVWCGQGVCMYRAVALRPSPRFGASTFVGVCRTHLKPGDRIVVAG